MTPSHSDRSPFAHPWDVSPAAAVEIQRRLAPHIVECPLAHPIRTVAGTDMSVRGARVTAAVVVLSLPALERIDYAIWEGPVTFPYVPGLLSFREVPALMQALAMLHTRPDVIMTDSQGMAHPRRFGLACHLGLLLDHPTIGVAKSRLTGRFETLDEAKGSTVPLRDGGAIVGAAVRTRQGTKPMFVSVGHRVTLKDAVSLTLAVTTRYRIPEPTRLAHLLSQTGTKPAAP
ncbi:MAG: endonuclease V [Caldilineaceae bacterium]|nr:endonuclease V [Caldilineaceae bacterium]